MHQYEQLVQENAGLKRASAETQRSADAKQKQVNQLKEELNAAKAQQEAAEDAHSLEIANIVERTKKDAAITVYVSKLKMSKEAKDPNFDKSSWDVESWKKIVTQLGGHLGDLAKETSMGGGSGAEQMGEATKEDGAGEKTPGDEGGKDKAWARFLSVW